MSVTAALAVIGELLINTFSFLLPGYFSFRSLESHSHMEPWITYWVVFAMFTVFEHWFWFIFSRIPGFLLTKFIFIIWLQFSNAQGAQVVYRRLLLPALRQHQSAIDRYLEAGESNIRKQMSQLGLQPGGHHASGVDSFSQPINRLGALPQASDIESSGVGKVS